ncbi:MAG: FkbM family methyltransferase [Alphaproteobacteria bacterium]|nr:MAG: FkbM family methyltransferase [Alphaproteobacteria bacterium]
MRDVLRRSLRRFGYDLHRYLPVSSPDAQLQALLDGFAPDLVLDIGANTGQYGALLRRLGYTGRIVSFEPLPDAHAALVAQTAADPRWTAAPRTAIGDHDGEITINIAGNSASSSLLAMLDSHRAAAPESAYVGTATAPIARLDSIAPPLIGEARQVHVKIDTQGYEAQVLAGGADVIAAAATLQIELSLTALYAGQASHDALLADLAARGLVLWGLWPGFAEPASGRILQVDALLARPQRRPGTGRQP